MKLSILAATAAIAQVFCTASSIAQSGPAFDCARAEHETEKLICQDKALSAKDRKLADVYQRAIAAMKKVDAGGAEAIQAIRTTQRGWISGRNECWKSAAKRRCTMDSYDRRTAYLQARYFLVDGGAPLFYSCDGSAAAEIVATFIPTEPPSVRLERGDAVEVGVLSPSASGSRYEANFGVYIWIKGNEAEVAWPQDSIFRCTARK